MPRLFDLLVLATSLKLQQCLLLRFRRQRSANRRLSQVVRLPHPANVVRRMLLEDVSNGGEGPVKGVHNRVRGANRIAG